MHNSKINLRHSMIPLCAGLVGVLIVAYIGLIAVVMSYGALTVEFTQSVRNDEAVVAKLESTYLETVTRISATDYLTAGYTKPITETYVPTKSATALR